MATKLERDTQTIVTMMNDTAREVDAFSKRKLATLPNGASWDLLKAALALVSAASKVQLAAAARHLRDTKAHFRDSARP